MLDDKSNYTLSLLEQAANLEHTNLAVKYCSILQRNPSLRSDC